ncbi:hypothetical protein BP6252_09092 [Coleophoma cylindrospora]|uniref:Uncharacterized protein n=1 Tax=Coleophoma cylindrospora TaxID=1849047 RepID=A0A3D8R0Z5_9HELO|nr:hypothetical protein BP6252_09092 [Coleophoma cylindrospora]
MSNTPLTESLRLRDTRQYTFLHQPAQALSSTKLTSTDTALTAFAQLVTWRLDAQRSVVSLLDRDSQYFIAESTPTLDIGNTGNADANGAKLWMGCSGSVSCTSRENALCAHVIDAPEPVDSKYALFWVPDLSTDPKFVDLPYVANAPFFKFYAGTPLVTRAGSRIGSLFVIDDRPRPRGLTDMEHDFLGLMATNVMNYLDMRKDNLQQLRSTVMSKGLAAFIEGRGQIPKQWTEDSQGGLESCGQEITKHDTSLSKTANDPERVRLRALPSQKNETKESQGSEEFAMLSRSAENSSPSHANVFARAAELLRESLAVDYTVFVDTASHFIPMNVQEESLKPQAFPYATVATEVDNPPVGLSPSRKYRETNTPATILAYAPRDNLRCGSDLFPSATAFRPISHHLVNHLIHRYSGGFLWSFDAEGQLISFEGNPIDLGKDTSLEHGFFDDDDGSKSDTKIPSKGELQALATCFPEARQILFAPIHDSVNSGYISATFAVSLKEVPVFTTEIEVAFVRAFLNSVAAEYDKVKVQLESRQKGDFISSISHEFRTPLHGILASTALLADSDLAMPQRNLCETIDSCGRTLFNTVSHILDYTKVNNFSQNPLRNISGINEVNDFSLHIYSVVNIAALCEDAIRTVTEGHIHDQISRVHSEAVQNTSLDLGLSDNHFFNCTPGAIQRVIMNLFGNSLKFTKNGFINCKVDTNKNDNCDDGSYTLRITVTDTGVGISDEFLRHRLYSAFSQESSFSSGTGLGLSIVKKIVQSLDGTVSVQSQIDQGTQVTVEIPLAQSKEVITETPDAIAQLKLKCRENTVCLSGFDSDVKCSVKRSLHLYITKWFHMNITDDLSTADFVIVDEKVSDEDIANFASRPTPPLVIIASSAATKDLVTHWVAKPVGPHYLAKTMLACWQEGQIDGLAKFNLSANSVNDPKSTDTAVPTRELNHGSSHDPNYQGSSALPQVNSGQDIRDIFYPENGKSLHIPAVDMPSSGPQLLQQPSFTILTRENTDDARKPRVRQPSILCVDDNTVNLKLIQAYLKKLKYTDVKCAVDGLEAAKAFESSETGYDLIFMDLSMPVCDGFESTKRIRKFEAQNHPGRKCTYIIALTGLAADRDQNMAFSCGMDAFVTKPLSLSHLKLLLEDWETTKQIP